jgi:NAD(P)H dehydrogenase (quinone)
MSTRILILYFSRNGSTQQLADAIAEGVSSTGAEAIMRSVSASGDAASERDLAVSLSDLEQCDGLIMGSPTRFGHMASALQQFWETSSSSWLRGVLVDKPAAVFTSSSSMHGGQETTLLSMMVPLLHHGMLLVGIPYTVPAIQTTDAGGTPYGASHVEHAAGKHLSADERSAAIALGARVGQLASSLKSRS